MSEDKESSYSSLIEELCAEHEVILDGFEALLATIMESEEEQALSREKFRRLKEELRNQAAAMMRHFIKEEEILFPLLESRFGERCLAPRAMRLEHEYLKDRLQRLLKLAERSRNLELAADKLADEIEDIREFMIRHANKEKDILFPMAERTLR